MTSAGTHLTEDRTIQFDLGTFEGFNFHTQSAIEGNLTAQQLIDWDHDKKGEAEFWPAGDRPEVSLLFDGTLTCSDVVALDRLLDALGGDSSENLLRIHHSVNGRGNDLRSLTAEVIEDEFVHIFCGTSFLDLRKEAAYELFELYYPEEYKVWEKSHCDGLHFNTDWFLDSPTFSCDEVTLGNQVALLVSPQ